MRVGEALGLEWSEVDFGNATITIKRSKTAAGVRVIPMTSLCKDVLSKWSTLTQGLSAYVFFNPQEPTTHIRSVKTAWLHALRTAKLDRRPLYNCRHTFATRLATAGVSDTLIDQLLGHARRDILDFYTGRVDEVLRNAVGCLEAFRSSKMKSSAGSGPVPDFDSFEGRSRLIQKREPQRSLNITKTLPSCFLATPVSIARSSKSLKQLR